MMMMLLYDEINTCYPSIIIEILHHDYLQSVKPSIVFFMSDMFWTDFEAASS